MAIAVVEDVEEVAPEAAAAPAKPAPRIPTKARRTREGQAEVFVPAMSLDPWDPGESAGTWRPAAEAKRAWAERLARLGGI